MAHDRQAAAISGWVSQCHVAIFAASGTAMIRDGRVAVQPGQELFDSSQKIMIKNNNITTSDFTAFH